MGASTSGRQQAQEADDWRPPFNSQQQQRQQLPLQPPARKGGVRALPEQDWGNSSAWDQDWDPMGKGDLSEATLDSIADEAEDEFRRTAPGKGDLRDTWITPLIDLQAIAGSVDPDQERNEENQQGEALANKDESQRALRYLLQLVGIPLATGFIISRALADPVLNFTLQNNEEAFAMTDLQKIEGAHAVHMEENKLRMEAAIGKRPPLSDEAMTDCLREFALELEDEERHHNEQALITVISDSISGIMLFGILAQQSRGRQALFNTFSRLFEGLSDIAKAIAIILIADTMLGYHSEEGWTGLIEVILGHYGFEADEAFVVIFVGTVPVVIDVMFKYWIFVGLNKISPGAVVTIKAVDTH